MNDLEAIHLARVQLQVRHAQLANCRVCGTEATKYEQAIERLKNIETQLRESSHAIPLQQSQS